MTNTQVTSNNNEATVTVNESGVLARLVPEKERFGFLAKSFPTPFYLLVESSIFGWMTTLCEQYNGGSWEFHALSNGGMFMSPSMKQAWVISSTNGNELTVSAEAAGLVATLFALSDLSFTYSTTERLSEAFHQVREFALDHAEASAIFRLID